MILPIEAKFWLLQHKRPIRVICVRVIYDHAVFVLLRMITKLLHSQNIADDPLIVTALRLQMLTRRVLVLHVRLCQRRVSVPRENKGVRGSCK